MSNNFHKTLLLGFLWVVPTNTGIFLRGSKLYGENSALGIQKEN